MSVEYDRLVIPQQLRSVLREVVKGVPDREIPISWYGIMVYHPATQQYYSTKSVRPLEYERTIRTRHPVATWNLIARSLQTLLNINHDFQFFVLHTKARHDVEGWMANQGFRRVSTKMGDCADEEHVLFKVYSPYNKIARYVSGPASMPKEQAIKLVNTSMATWLSSIAKQNRTVRETMQVALRSRIIINTRVFEDASEVTRTNLLVGKKHKEFRSICADQNLNAVLDFIRGTTTGG